MDFNGIRRLYLPSAQGQVFAGTKDSARGIGPVHWPAAAGMSHALSAGQTLSRPLQCFRVREIRYAFKGAPYERIAEDLISACWKHVVVATGSLPFKVRDNQRPERTMSGAAKTFA